MPPQKRAACQICNAKESKYACPKCMILYCSVVCFKQHKENSCSSPGEAGASSSKVPGEPRSTLPTTDADPRHDAPQSETSDAGPSTSTSTPHPPDQPEPDQAADPSLKPPSPPLRPLTSLKWPYVPEESAYPDPLKRDDPKPLQLHQYEAIATSPQVRKALASHPQLPALLRSIDALRGEEREDALQRALGVSFADLSASSQPGFARAGTGPPEEDIIALRELAETIEAAVRGGKEGALGLDWGD